MIDPKEYGRALFMLSEERGTTEAVRADMLTVCTVLRDNPSYLTLMDTPAVSLTEKEGLLERAFAPLDTDLKSFLKLLASRHSLHAFAAAYAAYVEQYEMSRGIIRAEAITAVPMTQQQRTTLTQKLCRITGKRVTLDTRVDSSILGGIRLRYLGKQIDSTLATRLRALEDAVKNTIV